MRSVAVKCELCNSENGVPCAVLADDSNYVDACLACLIRIANQASVRPGMYAKREAEKAGSAMEDFAQRETMAMVFERNDTIRAQDIKIRELEADVKRLTLQRNEARHVVRKMQLGINAACEQSHNGLIRDWSEQP